MSWQIALFFNIIFATIRNTIDKKLVTRIDPFLILFFGSLWSIPLLLLFYIIRHGGFPIIYPEMMLLGILFTFSIGSWLTAIKISLSQSVVFGSYYLLIPMLLSALFLGEWQLFNPLVRIGQKNIAGVALALISMLLILQAHNKKEGRLERRWFFLIAVNILLNGSGTFINKVFLGAHGPMETMISQTIGALPVILLINLIKNNQFRISKMNHVLVSIDSIFSVLAVIFFYLALKMGSAMLILPIQTLALTVLIVLVGLLLYKEAHLFDKGRRIGLLLGILGVGLLVI